MLSSKQPQEMDKKVKAVPTVFLVHPVSRLVQNTNLKNIAKRHGQLPGKHVKMIAGVEKHIQREMTVLTQVPMAEMEVTVGMVEILVLSVQ